MTCKYHKKERVKLVGSKGILWVGDVMEVSPGSNTPSSWNDNYYKVHLDDGREEWFEEGDLEYE